MIIISSDASGQKGDNPTQNNRSDNQNGVCFVGVCHFILLFSLSFIIVDENVLKLKNKKKVLDTIFGNAGLEYVFVDVERDEDEEIVSITSKGDDKKEVPPLSTTVNTADQADKLAKKLQKRLGEIPGVKYEVESVGGGADRQYKLVITGLSSDQRSKAQPIALDFKTSLKEASDAEMRRVLVRAGVIK